MESWYDKRRKGLNQIIKTLQTLDQHNLEHPEYPRVLNKEKLIKVVAMEYELSYTTAKKWVSEAMDMNSCAHEINLDKESIILGITEVPKEELDRINKEIQDVIGGSDE